MQETHIPDSCVPRAPTIHSSRRRVFFESRYWLRDAILALLEEPSGPSEPAAIAAADVVYSAESKAAFEACVARAQALGHESVGVADLLLAILQLDAGQGVEGPRAAGVSLRSAGLTPETIEVVRDALEARMD